METLEQLIAAIEAMEGNAKEVVHGIRDLLYPLHIKVSWEAGEFPLRIILNAQPRARFSIPLVRDCNGLIIEVAANMATRVICRPPREFCQNFSMRKVLANLDKYEIYPIYDGTVFNLYYADRWRVASKQGIDVTNRVWRGYTFGQALAEVLFYYPEFSWDRLDKANTYTIGIKHPALHPFHQFNIWTGQSNGIHWMFYAWLICETTPAGERNPSKDVGIPIVPPLKLTAAQLEATLKGQTSQYAKEHYGCLGYILRDWGGKAIPSDIMLTSDLMRDIRDLVYQASSNAERFRDMNYVVMHAYLSPEKSLLFENLFPQYAPLFEKYDAKVADICESIYRALKDKATPEDPDTKELFFQVRKHYALCGKDMATEIKNITAIILHPGNIDIFSRILLTS